MTVDILTAITGARDDLRAPITQPAGVRFRVYVDSMRVQDVPPWEVRPLDAPSHLRFHPRILSRVPKILGHLHRMDGEVYIWQDACAQLIFPDAAGFVNDFLRDADIALIGHERRDHRTEQQYCLEHRVGDTRVIAEQLDRYEADGFPGCPFVSGGLIARRHNERTVAFNELWWKQYRAGQERDQFSLAYSLWKAQRDFGLQVRVIHPSSFAGESLQCRTGASPLCGTPSIWTNPWFQWNKHTRRCPTGTGWKPQ